MEAGKWQVEPSLAMRKEGVNRRAYFVADGRAAQILPASSQKGVYNLKKRGLKMRWMTCRALFVRPWATGSSSTR